MQLFSLEDFLLPDSHPAVEEWRTHREATKQRKQGGGKREQGILAFEQDHLEMYSRAGLKWPPSQDDYVSAGIDKAIAHLPRRNQECVFYHVKTKGGH